jgi:hypothetical protein
MPESGRPLPGWRGSSDKQRSSGAAAGVSRNRTAWLVANGSRRARRAVWRCAGKQGGPRLRANRVVATGLRISGESYGAGSSPVAVSRTRAGKISGFWKRVKEETCASARGQCEQGWRRMKWECDQGSALWEVQAGAP